MLLDLAQKQGIVSGPGNCNYFVQYEGTVFKLVPGATPLCGTTIPGVKVSAS